MTNDGSDCREMNIIWEKVSAEPGVKEAALAHVRETTRQMGLKFTNSWIEQEEIFIEPDVPRDQLSYKCILTVSE